MAVTGVPSSPLGLFVKAHYSAPTQKAVFLRLKKKGFQPPAGSAQPNPDPTSPAPTYNPEESSLAPAQHGQLASFDAFTTRQAPRIQGAYDALGTSLQQNADQTKNRLASLGSLIQGQPLVGGTAGQGVPGADQTLEDARRQAFTANAAVTVGQQSALPAMAATTGRQYLDNFVNTRQGQRDAMLSGFLTSNATAAQKAQEVAAKLRGQDLNLLATQLTQKGGLDRATLAALTSQSNTAAREAGQSARTDATNQTRMSIAQMQAAARAATAGKAKVPAGKPGSPQYSSTRKDFVNKLGADFFKDQPVYENVKQPDGTVKRVKTGTAPQAYNTDTTPSILRGLALGLRPAHVFQALRGVDPGYGTDRADAREFQAALESGGIPRKRANAITKALTGFDIYPAAGYVGG